MSRERSVGNNQRRKRALIIKNVGCKYCSNNKMHSNGIRKWCTKCKKEQ